MYNVYNIMKKLLFILSIFFISVLDAHAADVSILAPKVVSDSKPFPISVNLDTSGNPINLFDITISYPKDIVTFKGYKEENSIKKTWFVSPTDSAGTVHFSGIIPGGVDGVYDPDKEGLQDITLVQLLFSANNNGQGDFKITHSDILQNDGLGTPLSHTNNNASIIISKNINSTNEEELEEAAKDKEPPQPFDIQFIPNELFSRTPAMIIFSTIDITPGVEKYQLQYKDLWKDVISPLPTPKGLLKRVVTIRAVDFDGNTRESRVEIPGLLSTMQLLAILFTGIICYFIYFVVKRKR